MLNYLVTDAKYLQDYDIELTFYDGSTGTVNLQPYLKGPIFTPLKDPAYFKTMQFNAELDTITWPNGADFAPEFLYALANRQSP